MEIVLERVMNLVQYVSKMDLNRGERVVFLRFFITNFIYLPVYIICQSKSELIRHL